MRTKEIVGGHEITVVTPKAVAVAQRRYLEGGEYLIMREFELAGDAQRSLDTGVLARLTPRKNIPSIVTRPLR